MNLKSLLIGSAAALVAAPAFAADVIIAEPEPVEYVEVCDVAGAGYFYIPGSRTCLQISGLVRHQLDFQGDRDASFITNNTGTNLILGGFVVNAATAAAPITGLVGAAQQDGIRSLVRGEVNFRTFTETELGDLTSFIRFRADDRNQDPASFVVVRQGNNAITAVNNVTLNGSAFLNNAVIGLGGLSLGLSDSLYDGGIAGEFDSFGGTRVHFIRYTADLGAFSASISAEAERENNSQNNYVPNVVGQIAGDVGPFSVTIWGAYDDGDAADQVFTGANGLLLANGTRVPFTLVDDDEYAAKITASFDLGLFGVAAGATYNSGPSNFDNGSEYSVAASATVGLGEKASLTFGGQYFFNQLAGAAVARNVVDAQGNTVDVFLPNRAIDGIDAYSIGANLDYEIVDGFDMKIAVNYRDTVIDDAVFVRGPNAATGVTVSDADGAFDGFIRFDRSF